MALELNPEIRQTAELGGFRLPQNAIQAVYHILLMKDALKNAKRQGDPKKFLQKFGVDFTKHDECKFHADLTVFRNRGIYIPTQFGDIGHYFSRDPLNTTQVYLVYRSRQSPETITLWKMANEICNNHWTAHDFSDVEKLRQGLVHGQLMWLGALSNFKHYEEPKLDMNRRHLTSGLLEYYQTQIGPMDINEGNSIADYTVTNNGKSVSL